MGFPLGVGCVFQENTHPPLTKDIWFDSYFQPSPWKLQSSGFETTPSTREIFKGTNWGGYGYSLELVLNVKEE